MDKSELIQQIRKAAYRYLARRDYSEAGLLAKLIAAFDYPEMCQQVIDELRAHGLLNDDRFIENKVLISKNRGLGPLRLQQVLKKQGLSAESIAQHVTIADNSWLENAKLIIEKRYRDKLSSDPKQIAKIIRFLQYRGFTFAQIRTVLSSLLTDITQANTIDFEENEPA